METIWVLGDQLDRTSGPLATATPTTHRVLLIEAEDKIRSKRWHRQRLHVILTAMRKFARDLRAEGFEVDHRSAATMRAGLTGHVGDHSPSRVSVMQPLNLAGRRLIQALSDEVGLVAVPNDQFLCSPELFRNWAEQHLDAGGKRLTLETFYRWQRTRLDIMIEPDGAPTGGRWNYDKENREPPPDADHQWPDVLQFELDEIDREVAEEIEQYDVWGASPQGWWPTTAAQARARLDAFVRDGLHGFGPHQDAMVQGAWSLSHSLLSPAINLGLLTPTECVDAAVGALAAGAPINSVEGFIRQIVGWREYVLGVYHLWMPEYALENRLGADRPVPPAFTEGRTDMACVRDVVTNLDRHGWNHHIERLMVIGNLALTAGVAPDAMVDWMWRSYVDAAEWVMVPNLIGMALHADGGAMATKPYASGGAYINRMSTYCSDCRYNPRKRTGDDACPFSTLYWDFLARNEDALRDNHRLGNQLGSMRRLKDLEATRERAAEVLELLDTGEL